MTAAVPPVDRPKLKREIGLWMATALVVGNMIGSGIFLLPASLAGEGSARDRVLALADEMGADALILAWSQRLMPERAAQVRSVLERSRIPVILVPVAHSDDRRAVPG